MSQRPPVRRGRSRTPGARELQLTALLLLVPFAPAFAQGVFPDLGDRRLSRVVHDGLHSVTGLSVAEGLRIFRLEEDTRYALGMVALPVAQEIYDNVRYKLIPGDGGINWSQAFNDIVTYQLPWAYYLARKGRWWEAVYVTAVYSWFLYTRYYSDYSDWERFGALSALSVPLVVSLTLR